MTSNRDIISNADQFKEAIDLAIKIQNSGIATCIAYLAGHCNWISFDVHMPEWFSGSDADYKIQIQGEAEHRDRNVQQLDRLKEIFKNGKQTIDEGKAIESKRQQLRRQQYEELKKEFEPQL